MNDLHKAWRTLGLDAGESKDAIERRYKQLAMVWHPDRFTNEHSKLEAEEELKKINDARDILFAHFDNGDHQAWPNCGCQPVEAESVGVANDLDEELAKRRDEERRNNSVQADDVNAQTSRKPVFGDTMAHETAAKNAKSIGLRWKVAAAEILVFASISAVGAVGWEIKDKIRSENFMRHVEQERNHPPSSPVYKMPAAIAAEEVARRELEKKRRETDTFNTSNEIDRHKRQISEEDNQIAKYQQKAVDQALADSEHARARAMIGYLENHKQQDIEGLRDAQRDLGELNSATGTTESARSLPSKTQNPPSQVGSSTVSPSRFSILDGIRSDETVDETPTAHPRRIVITGSLAADPSN